MRIALHNGDHRTAFPNLPLMKLSAWHKGRGDAVSWFMPLLSYDKVYSSKVFTYTLEDAYLPINAIRGGTGYDKDVTLPKSIEHIMPDYSLYPAFTASLGFTTRGCIRTCPWCIVPSKEGKIREHAEIAEFLRSDSRDVVLMDNNILAHEHGVRQIEWAIQRKLRLDCNQGLDARLIAKDDALAKLLARVAWIKSIRLACDTIGQMPYVEKAVKAIRRHSHHQGNFSCYVLVKDIPDALERVEFLRRLGVDPFAQPYRDFTTTKEPPKPGSSPRVWGTHVKICSHVSHGRFIPTRVGNTPCGC